MCNVTAYNEKFEELETYLTYVNTDIDRLMMYELELYAAYATHHGNEAHDLKQWYKDAEAAFITAHSIDLYLMKHYEFWDEEELDYYYEKAVHTDGLVFECMGYWFGA